MSVLSTPSIFAILKSTIDYEYLGLLSANLSRCIASISNNFHCFYHFAAFKQGNNHAHEYIATQHPLENTISDFWRMIHQESVHIVVFLNQMKEGKMVLYYCFLSQQYV